MQIQFVLQVAFIHVYLTCVTNCLYSCILILWYKKRAARTIATGQALKHPSKRSYFAPDAFLNSSFKIFKKYIFMPG